MTTKPKTTSTLDQTLARLLDLGPYPPAPLPPAPPRTLDEALEQLAHGDRGVIDRPALLAFIREQIATIAAKEQQKRIEQMSAIYSAHELGALADELDEDNYATAAQKLRTAIIVIARLEGAIADEREAAARTIELALRTLPPELRARVDHEQARELLDHVAGLVRARGAR